ncbi:hypothetical protein CEXT_15971 [Caerostris extrusa]|uniref:Uncharacterized protein n=1 Tax=Caerostris extrusa TaxID=172846 RepID=A0AAV4UCX5_CAEEX|nr:hypothetical protein CEXT_15971 [Caerostris extrusa]
MQTGKEKGEVSRDKNGKGLKMLRSSRGITVISEEKEKKMRCMEYFCSESKELTVQAKWNSTIRMGFLAKGKKKKKKLRIIATEMKVEDRA